MLQDTLEILKIIIKHIRTALESGKYKQITMTAAIAAIVSILVLYSSPIPFGKIKDEAARTIAGTIVNDPTLSASMLQKMTESGKFKGQTGRDGAPGKDNVSLIKPDVEVEFSNIRECQSIRYELPKQGLPKIVTAYYFNRNTGQHIPWGVNQYGDINQTNGILLDFDNINKVYIRTPCNEGINSWHSNILHLGYYKNRANNGNDLISNLSGLDFKLMLWY